MIMHMVIANNDIHIAASQWELSLKQSLVYSITQSGIKANNIIILLPDWLVHMQCI